MIIGRRKMIILSIRNKRDINICNEAEESGSTNYVSGIQYRCGSETGTEFAEYDRNGNIGEAYTKAKNGAAWETREGEESQRKKKSPGSSTRFRKRSGALVTLPGFEPGFTP